jgi:ferric-dicitrate binding protein FerR (iron transport regulator)
MAQRHTWRRSQREIREGKAPRRLAERRDHQHLHQGRRWSGAAHLARRVALAVSVLLLVIASTVVYSDDYGAASGSDAFWLSPSWRF